MPQPSTSHQDSDNSEDEANRPNPFAGEKMGAKKRAKLEAKAEKRQQREAELIAREVKYDQLRGTLKSIHILFIREE